MLWDRGVCGRSLHPFFGAVWRFCSLFPFRYWFFVVLVLVFCKVFCLLHRFATVFLPFSVDLVRSKIRLVQSEINKKHGNVRGINSTDP